MKMMPLGRTGISVSQICLGTMTWGEQNTQDEAHQQMNFALDKGINFIDTAELYAVPPRAETYGATEEMIGNWFAANGRREDWVLASKVAGPGRKWIREGRRLKGADVTEALEASLKRLQTDHLDLYQIHWPNRVHYNFDRSWIFNPYAQDKERARGEMLEILEALGRAHEAGKIRAIGLSNETSWGTMEFLRLAEAHGLPRVASIQNEYNLIRRQFDLDLAEVCFFEDVALMAYSPLAAGALSGKYMGGQRPAGTRGAIGDMWRLSEHSEPVIAAYVALAREHGLDPCQMALAWCLTRPFMSSLIIGATSMDQLAADIGAGEIVLSDEVMAGIEAIHRAHPRPI
ncbi:aldo/keto reductase [Pelagibacterium montanilacus]|uniref:aldo/keto reductase n=1 Tax=Pelagibacterium montanilacus TaxID=2185280 RepID=UPI000F8D1314|nr:aldo/keto reductase [Pelagibacterium montanilacus]